MPSPKNNKKKRMRILLICLAIILVFVVAKVIWVGIASRHNGDFESEKTDIMARRDFLIEKEMTSPQKLIDEMPRHRRAAVPRGVGVIFLLDAVGGVGEYHVDIR